MVGLQSWRSGFWHPPQQPENLLGRAGVQLAGRLVEHEDLRPEREDRGDRDLLLLPAGERIDRPVPQRRDADVAERFVDAARDLRPVDAEVFEAEKDLVLDLARDHLAVDVLEHAAHLQRERGQAAVHGVDAVHRDAAEEVTRLAVRHKAAQRLRQRRLARAARPGHADEIAVLDRHVDVVQRVPAFPRVAERKTANLDHTAAPLAHALSAARAGTYSTPTITQLISAVHRTIGTYAASVSTAAPVNANRLTVYTPPETSVARNVERPTRCCAASRCGSGAPSRRRRGSPKGS